MDTMLAVLYIILAAVALTADAYLAKQASALAVEKGCDCPTKWFWICFLFVPVGYILVAAMPDLRLRALLEKQQAKEVSTDIEGEERAKRLTEASRSR